MTIRVHHCDIVASLVLILRTNISEAKEIPNMFVLLNGSSIRGVRIKNTIFQSHTQCTLVRVRNLLGLGTKFSLLISKGQNDQNSPSVFSK